MLPLDMQNLLHDHGYYFLNQIANPLATTLFSQDWISSYALDMNDEHEIIWNAYTDVLKASHILLIDQEDDLIWDHDKAGNYTPNLGYVHLKEEIFNRNVIWWWK